MKREPRRSAQTSAATALTILQQQLRRDVLTTIRWLRGGLGWIGIGVLIIAATLFAAVTADDNPAMSIFAGVIVGSTVTAVVTWFVGPIVEKRIRGEARRDETLNGLLRTLLSEVREAIRTAENNMFSHTAVGLSAVDHLMALADTLRLEATQSGDETVRQATRELTLAMLDVRLAYTRLPVVSPDPDTGMVQVRFFQRSQATPSERIAYDALRALDTRSDQLLVIVCSKLGIPYPGDRLRKHYTEGLFNTEASQAFAMEVAQNVLEQFLEDQGFVRLLGTLVMERLDNELPAGRPDTVAAILADLRGLIGKETPESTFSEDAIGRIVLKDLLRHPHSERTPPEQALAVWLLDHGSTALMDLLSED